MSKAGIKIKNIQAGSIYEKNLGVRDNLDMKDAVQSHSLFLDFLLNNGLRVWKGESTRDIIAVDFSYGSRSYEEDLKHLKKIGNEDLIAKCEANRDKYDKKSKQELRTMFYTDGVNVTYDTHNKSGEIIKSETIHYQMLYRTPGKAKVGNILAKIALPVSIIMMVFWVIYFIVAIVAGIGAGIATYNNYLLFAL